MIKFLKKFKEKILIALACSFIGIGTLLNNTIDTYAYTTDKPSYTFQNFNGDTTYFDYYLSESITDDVSKYLLLLNFEFKSTQYHGIQSCYLRLYNDNSQVYNGSIQINRIANAYVNNVITTIIPITYSNIYTFNRVSLYNFSNSELIINADFIRNDELTLTPYLNNYVSNYQQQLAQLQDNYNTLSDNYNTLENNYNTLENNYNTLEDNYNTLENEYEQKQSEYDMLTNGQLGYLDYMEFYINNQSIEFGNDSETELNLNELIDYNLYANNSLNLSYFTTQQVNPNYLPLKIISYYDKLPVNLFSMYFNGVTSGIIKIGYYDSLQYTLKQISFDNTGTAIDSTNSSLINYEVFKGLNVDYIEYIEIEFNNADLIAGSINFNSTYNIAYSSGYTEGYNYGFNVSNGVNRDKINNARQEGYQNGYDVGKQEGIAIGSDANNSLYGVVIRTLLTLRYLYLNKYLILIY